MIAPEKPFQMLAYVAFNTLLDKFRSNTDPETVLLYYIGNAISSKQADRIREKPTFSSPNLVPIGISKKTLQPAARYITPERPVKGGEFDFGEFGYCDLGGLLEPWITALTRSTTIKNKHLIVIADSCYSGRLVEDFQQLALKEGPWNQFGCTVTVQSASSSVEGDFVGRFTPCFVYFNKPENRASLHILKQKWDRKSEEEKNVYRELNLPSPQLATTSLLDKSDKNTDSSTMEFSHIHGWHGFPLILFRDAGFFKFCYLSHLEMVGPIVSGTPTLKQLIFFMAKILESKREALKAFTRMVSDWCQLAVFVIKMLVKGWKSLRQFYSEAVSKNSK